MRRHALALAAAAAIAVPAVARDATMDTIESRIASDVSPQRLAEYHAELSREPHPAGSDGDRNVIRYLGDAFAEAGLEVERHEIEVYLSRLVDARLELVAPVQESLSIQEPPVEGDASSRDPRLGPGWNAYSGTGDVTAPLVYANYGTMADFEELAAMGVSCEGKIVIARYGRNFRGYKAKYAEAAGAVGLLIYTDPEDAVHGLMYPQGGWANPGSIQRGSIKTLDYPGDPLTPGVSVNSDGPRLDPDAVALPRIPVQPIGWGAAERILRHMSEAGATPAPEAWQGGLLFNYALTGGEDVRVRLKVDQERATMRTANVIARLPGAVSPEEQIVIGCHHDAWTFGAGDPNAGLMIVLELARIFGELAEEGVRLDRTLTFAAWGAEEFGIIGSTEWVEEHHDALRDDAVAYINLDMAAMGPNFWASATPSLKRLIVDASKSVPDAGAEAQTVYDVWSQRTSDDPDLMMGTLGGGSDHVPFVCHVAVPSVAMGASGARGISYHSNYDTLEWYRLVVGEDYRPAQMIARVAGLAAARLAHDAVLPYDPDGYAADMRRQIAAISARADELGVKADFTPILRALDRYRRAVSRFDVMTDRSPDAARDNRVLRDIEKVWLREQGMPDRPWYRNIYVAPDPTSGYSAWMLPMLRGAVESGDARAVANAAAVYADALRTAAERIDDAWNETFPEE